MPLDCSEGGGSGWVAEGLVVPRKPGNAGGGKGPQVRVLWREERGRRLALSLGTPWIPGILRKELYSRAKRVGSPRMPWRETGLESRVRETARTVRRAGRGNQSMAELLRHLQRKREATDKLDLRARRPGSTLLQSTPTTSGDEH